MTALEEIETNCLNRVTFAFASILRGVKLIKPATNYASLPKLLDKERVQGSSGTTVMAAVKAVLTVSAHSR